MSDGVRIPWLIRLALSAFPRAFRDAHTTEMEEDYAEARSKCETSFGRARVTIVTAADLIVNGLRERRAARARSRITERPDGRRQERGSALLEDLGADARYALRALRRNSGYTAAAVVTLGLGIGANTAVFSVMDAVLLRPLPYSTPERLVLAGTFERGEPAPAAPSARYAEYVAWRGEGRTLEAMGAYTSAPFQVMGGQEPVLAQALVIDAGLLPVLGVTPQIGVGFTPDLDVDGSRAVLLSHDHWQSNFGGDPRIVGRTIELNGQPYQVRGVLPAGFEFPPATRVAEGWWSIEPALYVSPRAIASEIGNYRWWVVGRLADGATAGDAAAELAALRAGVAGPLPGEAAERDVHVVALQEAVVGPLRPALLAFLGAVALVLLIACVNLGALMLARLSARERELGVRLALGAGRRRIARQLATETMIVAALGGVAGIAISAIGLQALLGAAPQDLPGLTDAALNVRVLVFAFAVTATAGGLVGVLPTLSARGVAAGRATGGARGAASERATRRTHGVLVVTEVALAAGLLVAAGLLIRSFGELAGIDPGFRHHRILTIRASVPSERYPRRSDILTYYDEIERRVAALPDVVAVSAVDRLPFGGSSSRISVQDGTGQAANVIAGPTALNLTARPGYFEAMEIPLIQGRGFDGRDALDAEPAAVVSRSLAERLWPEGDVIGRHVTAFGTSLEVVGVVGDVRHFGPAVAPESMLYFTHATDPVLRRSMTLVVRTRSSPETLAPLVRAEIRAVDPLVPISDARSFSALRAEKVAGERFNALLVGVFGALALLLVAVGIYGVMAFAIVHRTREIGVRMALGASSAGVVGKVLADAARLIVVGLAIGLLAALPLARLLRGLLFGIEPLDPVTFATAAAVMALVGMLAALLPARRAAGIEPLAALRQE
jgi:predicted permease